MSISVILLSYISVNYVKEVCHESCDGRCFGNKQNQCCHPECAAGCNGPRKDQCFVRILNEYCNVLDIYFVYILQTECDSLVGSMSCV